VDPRRGAANFLTYYKRLEDLSINFYIIFTLFFTKILPPSQKMKQKSDFFFKTSSPLL
jgi:hypothetical protein